MRFTAPVWPGLYVRRPVPGPGSQNLQYTLHQLPLFSPIGNGWDVEQQWMSQRADTTQQVVLNTALTPGISVGQLFTYPLSQGPINTAVVMG